MSRKSGTSAIGAFSLALSVGFWPATPCRAQTYDLTGCWRSDDDAVYRVRQVGSKVFWSVDHAPHVINVFAGTLAGDLITGTWADVPGGSMQGTGALALRVESADRLAKAGESSSYGGTFWERTSCEGAGGMESPPAPPPPPATPPASAPPPGPAPPAGGGGGSSGLDLSGCWQIQAPQGNWHFVSIFPDASAPPGGYLFQTVNNTNAGDTHEGTVEVSPTAQGDVVTATDTASSSGYQCVWSGRIVGSKKVPGANAALSDGHADCDPPPGSPHWESDIAWLYLEDQGECAARGLTAVVTNPAPLYDAVIGLGSLWTIEGAEGWKGEWKRRPGTDTFDGRWWRGSQTGATTVVTMERTGNRVVIRRIASTDGTTCLFEGQISGKRVTGTNTCSRGSDHWGPFDFSATIHP